MASGPRQDGEQGAGAHRELTVGAARPPPASRVLVVCCLTIGSVSLSAPPPESCFPHSFLFFLFFFGHVRARGPACTATVIRATAVTGRILNPLRRQGTLPYILFQTPGPLSPSVQSKLGDTLLLVCFLPGLCFRVHLR